MGRVKIEEPEVKIENLEELQIEKLLKKSQDSAGEDDGKTAGLRRSWSNEAVIGE